METSMCRLRGAFGQVVKRDGRKASQIGVGHDLTRLDGRGITEVKQMVGSGRGLDGLEGKSLYLMLARTRVAIFEPLPKLRVESGIEAYPCLRVS